MRLIDKIFLLICKIFDLLDSENTRKEVKENKKKIN